MTSASRVGFVSATGLCLVGIVYIFVVAFGVTEAGLSDPIADPTLAVMEVLTMLSAGRQSGFTVLEWPSTLYVAELLAWDVLLGLSLIFAALTFNGNRLEVAIRWALVISGALALIGTLGPIVGNMALQRPGILGYGLGLPIAAFMLAIFFRRRTRCP